MNQTKTIKEKIKLIFIMIIPILITQLGMFSMVLFNTIMTGRYDSSALAGVAIGTSIWNPVFSGIASILLAISPIVAQYLGEKNNREISTVLTHGVYLSLILTIMVIILGFLFLNPLLENMDVPQEVRNTALNYLIGVSFGILPLFIFNVLRSYIYALGKPRVIMIILLSVLPLNILINYVLIFGKWGFPELGGAGGGYATTVTYWIILGMTAYIVITKAPFCHYFNLSYFKSFSFEKIKDILRIGVPMGLSGFFESSVFAVVTILISAFGVTTVAAYQTALNIVSFLYMIPLSISMALTVLVGFEVGARRYEDAKAYSWLGILISVVIAVGSGLTIVLFRYQVAGLYSTEAEVIALTAHFLIFALFFTIADANQVTVQAALRGYKDVNVAFITTLISYWLICLPAGYLLAHFTPLEARGYWIGLTFGLFFVGILLSFRLIHIQKHKFIQEEDRRLQKMSVLK